MSYTRYSQDYRKNHILTADRGTILLMLYQGAIDFLRRAKASLESGDMAEKGERLLRAQAIIAELHVTLDVKAGGEMTENLERLYLFMLDQITKCNLNNDPEPLENVISLLCTLKEGWEGAVAEVKRQAAQEAT